MDSEILDINDVVEVTKSNGDKGLMCVCLLLDDGFIGRYVYQKMDMYDYYKAKGKHIRKRYDKITKVVRKKSKIL